MNGLPLHLVFALAALILVGCPGDDSDPDGPCDGIGEPQFSLWQRGTPDEIVDGADLPVFPPPQGGVFTEMDIVLRGVLDEEVESLDVEVTDGTGTALAVQNYNGLGLPLQCQGEGELRIDNMPVGFEASTILEDLEGVAATLTVTLTTTDEGNAVVERSVILRVQGF